MKDKIKSILREGTLKNSLGVTVTKPDQVLVVMRGIPGSGKSTKAKQLVGNGIIHSTDDLIESKGDYREFFANMVSNGNFAPLGQMHNLNFKNAVKSMQSGISPVIIDNTNIRPNEPKNYIEAALNMGYDDKNIKFVEIGTGGLSAEELANRNTHGVPLDKIKSMIQAYESAGPMTLEKVLNSKSMYQDTNVLYSAVVLNANSKSDLLNRLEDQIPEGWNIIAHHMTIVFGKPVPNQEDLNKDVTLTVTELGLSDMAMAVKVEGYPSNNAIPHITIAVNPNGGKPVMSNDITEWTKINPFKVVGKVTEIKK